MAIGAACLCLLLGGCATGRDAAGQADIAAITPSQWSSPHDRQAPARLTEYWTVFGDPTLDHLVALAVARNLDIAQGASRLAQAREALVQARAGFLPQISGSAGVSRSFLNDTPKDVQLSASADAQWQLDLFGGISSSVAASRASLAAAGFDLADIQTAIVAEVAQNYLSARLAQQQLAIARDTLRYQDENLQITQWRVQAGLVSSLDVEQARTQRAQTAASIPALETSFANAANRISVLIGEAPGGIAQSLDVTDSGVIPQGPTGVAAGVPADVIRQRPDINAAEARLAAAYAQVGVERAQLFPALEISGNIGTSSLGFSRLLDSFTTGLFAGLSQLIFDGGRTQAAVRAAQEAAEGALAAYRQSVLNAFEDVENALAARNAARTREAEYTIALEAANNAAILARSQYQAGLTDFQTLLTAEQSLLSARNALAGARADRAQSFVQFYQAMGGGWSGGLGPDSAPSTNGNAP